MNWQFKRYGNDKDPKIAFIATSNGLPQQVIEARIKLLEEKGFCVMAPVYDDGSLLIDDASIKEKTIGQERVSASFSPAISTTDGADQVIQAIENGWNIMPLMGGDSFEEKIPSILSYFEKNPSKKNPSVKFFGLSNATYSCHLMAEGICTFIATPFTSIFRLAKNEVGYKNQAEQLEQLLREEAVESYSRKILSNKDKLVEVKETTHYPLNIGPIFSAIGEEKLTISLAIPQGQAWSFAFEGFIENPENLLNLNYGWALGQFLEKYSENLPKFIEIGIISTRLDGENGYANLQYNKEDGSIDNSDYNVDKIFDNRKKLKSDLLNIINPSREIQDRERNRLVKLSGQVKINLTNTEYELSKEDVKLIIASENERIAEVRKQVVNICDEKEIPLVFNPRYGHFQGMSVVDGGKSSFIKVDEEDFIMGMMVLQNQKSPSPSTKSTDSLCHLGGHNKNLVS